jgi:hypothetical protein
MHRKFENILMNSLKRKGKPDESRGRKTIGPEMVASFRRGDFWCKKSGRNQGLI